MPPRQKKEVEAVLMVDDSKPLLNPEPSPADLYLIRSGDFVHVITRGGSKYKSSEVLSVYGDGLTLRTDIYGPTQSEVSFIPWSAIDGVGLIGKR